MVQVCCAGLLNCYAGLEVIDEQGPANVGGLPEGMLQAFQQLGECLHACMSCCAGIHAYLCCCTSAERCRNFVLPAGVRGASPMPNAAHLAAHLNAGSRGRSPATSKPGTPLPYDSEFRLSTQREAFGCVERVIRCHRHACVLTAHPALTSPT
jgi:hypothetical protein